MIKEGGMPSFLSPSSVTCVSPCPTSSLPTRRNDSKRQRVNTKAITNPNNVQNKLRVDGQEDIDKDEDSKMMLKDREVREKIQ